MPEPLNVAAPTITASRQPIVLRGRVEPLERVPFHHEGPLTRWIMANAAMHPGLNCYIAVHEFSNVAPAHRDYCEVHVHDFDEINVFHSTSHLRVSVTLGHESIEIEAPATIVVPAGTPHAANVIEGSGQMIAILMQGTFEAVSAPR
jgi:hypothetical protein